MNTRIQKKYTSIKYITKTNKTWKIVAHLERSRACNGISHNWYTAKMFAAHKSSCQCCRYKFAGRRRERTWQHYLDCERGAAFAFPPRPEHWWNLPVYSYLPHSPQHVLFKNTAELFESFARPSYGGRCWDHSSPNFLALRSLCKALCLSVMSQKFLELDWRVLWMWHLIGLISKLWMCEQMLSFKWK